MVGLRVAAAAAAAAAAAPWMECLELGDSMYRF